MLHCLLIGAQGAALQHRSRGLQANGNVEASEHTGADSSGSGAAAHQPRPLQCAKHSAVNSRVTLDAMAIRERWPDGIPEEEMRRWALDAAKHNQSTPPGQLPHHLRNQMNHHHVLISRGRVYISELTDVYSHMHIPPLHDILEVAPSVWPCHRPRALPLHPPQSAQCARLAPARIRDRAPPLRRWRRTWRTWSSS